MDILKIFGTDKDSIRRSHVKNLLSVALADGHLDSDEWDMLVTISRILGITEEQINQIRKHPDSISFVPPRNYDDKVQQIQDLVAVMTVDGHISSRELALCKKISLKLDILPQLVDDIVSDIFQHNTISSDSSN